MEILVVLLIAWVVISALAAIGLMLLAELDRELNDDELP